jgi:hypothetical protein
MSTIRTLTTVAAALALAGGIGFAYAQTATNTTQQAPATNAAAPMTAPALDATTAPGPESFSVSVKDRARTDASVAPTERAPKADRG